MINYSTVDYVTADGLFENEYRYSHNLIFLHITNKKTGERFDYTISFMGKEIRETYVWHFDKKGYAVSEDGVYLHEFIAKFMVKSDVPVSAYHIDGNIKNNRRTNIGIVGAEERKTTGRRKAF